MQFYTVLTPCKSFVPNTLKALYLWSKVTIGDLNSWNAYCISQPQSSVDLISCVSKGLSSLALLQPSVHSAAAPHWSL
jgi:hypothetical protein